MILTSKRYSRIIFIFMMHFYFILNAINVCHFISVVNIQAEINISNKSRISKLKAEAVIHGNYKIAKRADINPARKYPTNFKNNIITSLNKKHAPNRYFRERKFVIFQARLCCYIIRDA